MLVSLGKMELWLGRDRGQEVMLAVSPWRIGDELQIASPSQIVQDERDLVSTVLSFCDAVASTIQLSTLLRLE